MLVEKLQDAGFTLVADGNQLKVTGTLTDDQRQFIRNHKSELLTELKAANDSLSAMRASQPDGWGWWGYLLSDGGQGSIRGPYPDRQSAITALKAEFPEQGVIKIVPFPGSLPEPDSPKAEKPEVVKQDVSAIECRHCEQWTADNVNPTGGMGRCAKRYPQPTCPWSTCKEGRSGRI